MAALWSSRPHCGRRSLRRPTPAETGRRNPGGARKRCRHAVLSCQGSPNPKPMTTFDPSRAGKKAERRRTCRARSTATLSTVAAVLGVVPPRAPDRGARYPVRARRGRCRRPPSLEWLKIAANRHRLLTKGKSAAFAWLLPSSRRTTMASRVRVSRPLGMRLAVLKMRVEKHGTAAKLR